LQTAGFVTVAVIVASVAVALGVVALAWLSWEVGAPVWLVEHPPLAARLRTSDCRDQGRNGRKLKATTEIKGTVYKE